MKKISLLLFILLTLNQLISATPQGRLQPYLIYPNTNINATVYNFFDFSSGVQCIGGECGNVTAILDPKEGNRQRKQITYNKIILEGIVPDKNPEERLKEINERINEKGARWKAELTPKALLPITEKRKLLGNVIFPKGNDEFTIYIKTDGSNQPAYFDWRDRDGENWMTSVKDQGGCGSCWAFSAVGTVEAAFNIFNNDPDLDLDLSEQQLVSDNGVCCLSCGNCYGGWPSEGLDYIKNTGIVNEACFPYTASDLDCNLCGDWQNKVYKIDDYLFVFPNTTEAYKQALMDYGPLSIGIDVSDMFFYYSDGIYEELEEINFTGLNHAIVLVGWNDTGGYWIAKNSWGPWWGTDGYAKLFYGSIEKYDYVYAINTTGLFDKGSIPMNNGTPFYTINQNPIYSLNQSCLKNMQDGGNCNQTWVVNATGKHLSKYEFFVLYSSNDDFVGENKTEIINISIIGNYVPKINSVECEENDSFWVDCFNISYGDNLTKVRINCTDSDGIVTNITVKLENIPDNNFFFDASSDLSYWTYDNNDINIRDSGDWRMTIMCTDDGGPDGIKNDTLEIKWIVPWGDLQAYLIKPLSDISIDKNDSFNFSSGVNCTSGECGDVTAILDPSSFYKMEYIPHEWDNCSEGVVRLSYCDDCYVKYTFPWAFNFFGNDYNQVYLSSNGIIDFDTASSQCCCHIQGSHHGQNMIAAEWEDGYLTNWNLSRGDIRTCEYSDHVVIDYSGGYFSDAGLQEWQILLFKNGDIKINYGSISRDSCNAAVGISGTSLEGYLDGKWSSNGDSLFFYRKGAIQMNNGTPFYTINQNPFDCENMGHEDVCEQSWTVYATGYPLSSWDIFTVYQSDVNMIKTGSINVMITELMPNWELTLNATNQLEPVTFGVKENATDDYDDAYDILSQTPLQDKVIIGLDDLYVKNIKNHHGPKNWTLDVGVPTGQSTTLSWKLNKSYFNINLTLYNASNSYNMHNTDSLFLNEGKHEFTIKAALRDFVEFDLNTTVGWNMISIPLISENKSTNFIFKDCITTLGIWPIMEWQYPLFTPVTELDEKKGYWLYSPEPKQCNIYGSPIQNTTLYLSAGWNMIGTVSIDNLNLSLIPNQIEIRPPITWYYPIFININETESGKSAWIFVMKNTEVTI